MKVYGSGPFAAESSICRAGLLKNIINNESGGYMLVSYSKN